MENRLSERDRVGVQDFVLLEDYQNELAFIDNLKKRFMENLIYTYIGQVLVSVNPYKHLPIYTAQHIKEYQKVHFFEASPHVFALTDTAYRSLTEEHREQCILISGESGSGKTEASKKVLQFIAAATGHQKDVELVKNKLLQSNPVLEAFGNAKTNRNVNSSRFGKYMDIQFNFAGQPVGGNILNYLLEKSRVVHQSRGERNFHIFYQLLAGGSVDELEKLHLKPLLNNYFYLSDGEKGHVPQINDAEQYREVKNAMKVIELSDGEQDDIFRIVASVLHMGNVEFGQEDGVVEIRKLDNVDHICDLLGCSVSQLKKAFTHRTIEARGDVVVSPLNRDLAIYARDALAKALYDRLFTWLVRRLNSSLQSAEKREYKAMGVLDIYGFEIFEKNSFEQFCINFCNEKLQQLFIELTLKSEQEEYLREGIEWEPVEYFNNKVICDLIEEKHKGIIALMDEECLRPGEPTDITLIEKMTKNLSVHEHYISHKKADVKTQKIMGRDEFRLVHYAGSVTYNIKGFIEKNNDLLFRDLCEAMTKSTNSIIVSIFPTKELTRKKRPDTAVTQFKNSLNDLMVILMNKEPSYIRCIKPNDNQTSSQFDNQIVMHQVKYLGLMENLRVRRAGFAYRRPYEVFLQRYKSLCKETWPNYRGTAKEGVRTLVSSLAYAPEDFRMGKTKLFIRFPKTLFETEDAFQIKKHHIAAIIQSRFKGMWQRRKYLKMRSAAIVIQAYMRRHLAKKSYERRRNAANAIRRFIKGFITRNDLPNAENLAFVEIAKVQWLFRLSKSLPKKLLDQNWPVCPMSCNDASLKLRKIYRCQLSRIYRRALTPQRKEQLDLKVLAESLFKGKKKSYEASVPKLFVKERLSNEHAQMKQNFAAQHLSSEKIEYSSLATKYDRRGYKSRERAVLLSNKAMYVVEVGKAFKQKHRLPYDSISIVVTNESDHLCVVRIPPEMKKDKGDLILEIPNVVEAVTKMVDLAKSSTILNIMSTGSIEHKLANGKQGLIEIKSGPTPLVQKDKSGHLLVVASN